MNLNTTILIPEQREMLVKLQQQMIDSANKATDELRIRREDARVTLEDSNITLRSTDLSEMRKLNASLKDLELYSYILNHSTLTTDYSSDVIDIGTRFQIRIIDSCGIDEMDFILVHKKVGLEANDLYVSCEAPLGVMVKGKKVGDIIQYKDVAGSLVEVEILKIYENRLGNEQKDKAK